MAELPDVFAVDDTTERMNSFEPMPDGFYLGFVKKSEIKKTKAGTGLRLNLQVEVQESKDDDDKYKGRLVFIGLNIKNPSEVAVQISKKELASLCDAVGVSEVEDSDELHDIDFGFKLGLEKSDGYDDRNIIKAYITESAYNDLK